MRLIRLLHKWTGLVAGLFLFILCLTGALIALGRVCGSYAPFFRWCSMLHRSLFLGASGEVIVGIASLLMVVLIITGYALWVREARKLVRASRRRGVGWCRGIGRSLSVRFPNAVMGWHVAGGVYVGLPILLMALTGLTWSFGWYAQIVYYLFDNPSAGSWDSNLFHTLHALHVGSWWQPWSRILWIVVALVGASLPVTGILLWLRGRRHKR